MNLCVGCFTQAGIVKAAPFIVAGNSLCPECADGAYTAAVPAAVDAALAAVERPTPAPPLRGARLPLPTTPGGLKP